MTYQSLKIYREAIPKFCPATVRDRRERIRLRGSRDLRTEDSQSSSRLFSRGRTGSGKSSLAAFGDFRDILIFDFCIKHRKIGLIARYKPCVQGGFGLIEILVAVSVAALLIIGLERVTQVSLALLREERMNFEAALLASEGIEALRMLRDASWSRNIAALSTGTDYFVSATSTWGIWSISQPYIRGRYYRTIRLDTVEREVGTDRIIDAGGYDDLGTRKLTATVSWQGRNGTSSVSSVTYLTNFLQN